MRRISPRSILSAIGLSVCLLVLIFIFNTLNNPTNDDDVLPIKCDCPTLPPQIITPASNKIEVPVTQKVETSTSTPKVETPTPTKIDVTTSTQTLPSLPPCKPVEKESAVQRAIIIYYPHHQAEYFFPEVRWYVMEFS